SAGRSRRTTAHRRRTERTGGGIRHYRRPGLSRSGVAIDRGVRLPAGLAPEYSQERAERGGPCSTSRRSQGGHHRRAARGVRRCLTQLQLFHPAGAVPCLGLPLHPARAAGRRRKPFPSGVVGEVQTRRGERGGGLTVVPAHLRGWPESAGHELYVNERSILR